MPSASRSPSRTPIPNSDWWTWRLRRSWISAASSWESSSSAMPRQARANTAKSSGAHRLRRADQRPLRCARIRLRGGAPSGRGPRRARTTRHPTATPPRCASCSRARRAMPTSFDAPTAVIGARCVSHDRGLNAPSSAQSVRASHSPTARTICAWSRSATVEQLDQLIRTGRARPLAAVLGVQLARPRGGSARSGHHRTYVRFYPKGYDTRQGSIQSLCATHSMPCHARYPR